MKSVQKLWNYFSGKKTLWGLVLYFVLNGLKGVGYLDEASYDQSVKWVYGLVGFGIAHKLWKWSH